VEYHLLGGLAFWAAPFFSPLTAFSALTLMLPVWKAMAAFRQLEILGLNHSANQFDL